MGFRSYNGLMSLTSKSPKAVLLTAHHIAQAALPAYRHTCGPKKFTQHQLFACLVLKAMLKLDYRGLCGLLQDSPEFREAIGLRVTPHDPSFQKAAARMLGDAEAAKLLDATLAGGPSSTPTAAIDSTGLTTSHASEYFTRRRRETGEPGARTAYHSYAKLALVCDIATHQILAFGVGVGPSPDVTDFVALLDQAQARRGLGRMLADAGYDSEPNHAHAREEEEGARGHSDFRGAVKGTFGFPGGFWVRWRPLPSPTSGTNDSCPGRFGPRRPATAVTS